MLYITTRDDHDAHTAYKTLVSDFASDGGLYIPFQMPVFDRDRLLSLKNKSFGDIVADLLNCFFSAGLTGWDVACAIGRNSVKLKSLGQKSIVVEPWHNPGRSFAYLENSLFQLVGNRNEISKNPTNWGKIAVRIALLFGVYGQLRADDYLRAEETFHVSVRADSLTFLVAVLYAREMGLPIAMTLCADAAQSGVWDFVHHGRLNTNRFNGSLPADLERLTHAAWGKQVCQCLHDTCKNNAVFTVPEGSTPLSENIFCSVIGNDRIGSVINSVYRNNAYFIDSDTAVSFAAVQDYRAKAGENRLTVMFGQNDPALSADFIADAIGIAVSDVTSGTGK